MNQFLSIILFLIVVQNASATSPTKYRVHIVTWDGSNVTGKLNAINDSTLTIKDYNGKIYTFSARQTKNLKIWRPWIKLPAAVAGATALAVLLTDNSSNRTCLPDVKGLAGIPLGFISGLIAGDLIAAKFNKRKMHISDFNKVSGKL